MKRLKCLTSVAAKSDQTKFRPMSYDQSVVWDFEEAGQMAQTQLGGPLLPSSFLLPTVSSADGVAGPGWSSSSHPGLVTDLMMATTC